MREVASRSTFPDSAFPAAGVISVTASLKDTDLMFLVRDVNARRLRCSGVRFYWEEEAGRACSNVEGATTTFEEDRIGWPSYRMSGAQRLKCHDICLR